MAGEYFNEAYPAGKLLSLRDDTYQLLFDEIKCFCFVIVIIIAVAAQAATQAVRV